MKSYIVTLFFLGTLIVLTNGEPVFDMTSNFTLTVDQFQCLRHTEFGPFVSRVYSSDGEFDEIGWQNLYNSMAANFFVDMLIVPCFNAKQSCKNGLISGADQANAVINRVIKEDLDLYFFYIEIQGNQWPSNKTANQAFILDMINTIKNATVGTYGVGIKTSHKDWSAIVGSTWTGASTEILYWVNWNGKPDVTTGFIPFGGWTSVCLHQYAGNVATNNCTAGVPINYDYHSDGACTCGDSICYKDLKKHRRVQRFLKRSQ
uniref:Uncharacterized protein n=1 Tax=Acrobeloides nanus TaxID=290746 RepID=A0A914DTP4_9BILA